MYLLPIAWGLTWRAVNGRGRAAYALAALAVGVTVAMHFIVGYLALLSIGVFVIVVWRGLPRRIGRGMVVFTGAALIASWVVVPLLADANFSVSSQFNQNTFWLNSYGAPQVLGWLFSGQIFDYGRLPIVSLLVALGTVVCLVRARRDARARALLGLMTVSLLLFCGRDTFGLILNLLPGSSDLLLHRFIMGVHLAGDLLAGVGLAWAGGLVIRLVRTWRPRIGLLPITAGLIAAAVLITLPAWLDRAAYESNNAANISLQIANDQTDGVALNVLLDEIKARGGGRTYAGLPGNWGKQYQVGQVPVYEYLADHDVDEVGFTLRTSSLVTDNEAYFNEADPAQYQLYGIRYVLTPSGMTPPVAATFLASSGRHRLWQVANTGYLQVVDTVGTIAADRSDMANQMQPFLQSAEFHQGQLATVAFAGAAAAPSTLSVASAPTTPPGTSTDALIQAQDGFFAGQVVANRTAAVLLKATYDPRWSVTVDGSRATPYMVVPGFVAVTVGPGQHSVVFQYVPYPHYGLLLAIGALTLLALALVPWLWRRWDLAHAGRASFRTVWRRAPSVGEVAKPRRAERTAPGGGARPRTAPLRRIARGLGSSPLLARVLAGARRPRLRTARLLPALPYVVAAAVATSAVLALQVHDRAPLVWDEAVRVSQGWGLTTDLQNGDLAGAWQWVNQQTFYPFLNPMFHGLLMWAGADPVTAAWIPSLIAWALTGVAVAGLIREMGGTRPMMWAGAVVFWLVPLSAGYAASAYTEPVGALGFTVMAFLLVRLLRSPGIRTAALLALVVAALSWLKWDYGILAVAVLVVSTLLATWSPSALRSVRAHQLALLGALGLMALLLKQNFGGKLQGLANVGVASAYPGSLDPLYFPRAFFTSYGISPWLGVAIVLGAGFTVTLWRARPLVRPALVLVVAGYLLYTGGNNLQVRFLQTYLPALIALGIIGLDAARAPLKRRFATRLSRLPAIALPVAAALAAVAVVVPQAIALTGRVYFLAPDPVAADAQALFGSSLATGSPVGVAYVAATNEVSAESIRLAAEQLTGIAAPPVEYVYQADPASQASNFLAVMGRHQGGELFAVRILPGSHLDTVDYHLYGDLRIQSDDAYFAFAQRMEASGCLKPVTRQSLENGSTVLVIWQIPSSVDLSRCGV